ncbi:MAG TPA: ribonuclease HI family protein [Dehalococcoidia bacterium]|nr:ribonuclease HI family protein [Dehalococcoidia bacterium]
MRDRTWTVYADGASRGNPGRAAIGSAVYDESGRLVEEISQAIGFATNNVAEYRSAIAGLEAARRRGAGAVELRMDSELVVRQLQGRYRVRHPNLRPLWTQLTSLAGAFPSFRVRHVPREMNKVADALANRALDGANRQPRR